ncbi:cytochrome P450 CYP736A12 [Trifolium repens]|nr:cytochrome P450 CYP736A12 [Trifolium repens]
MSSTSITILVFLLFTFIYLLFKLFLNPKHKTKPPGPPTLPIIGNLHVLGKLPYRKLQSVLSEKYGPIMFLQLGQIPTIIISSSKAAESFLKTQDIVFASRRKIQASLLISYGSKGFAFSEYDPYWRSMKKLCTLKLLSASKVEMFGPIRQEELGVLVKVVKENYVWWRLRL